MIGAGIGLLVAAVVLGGIGAAVYFAVRGGGSGDALSFRSLLRAYLRLAFLVSLGVFMVGGVMALTAAFGGLMGHDFSYGQGYGGVSICSGAAKSQPNCSNPPGREEDPRPKQDLVRGLSLLVTGLLIGVGHRAGQFAMESEQERRHSGLTKAEYLAGTAVFGLVSIVAIPAAAYALLSFYLISPTASNDAPGPNLATAIVFTVAWGYYLNVFVRRVRLNPE